MAIGLLLKSINQCLMKDLLVNVVKMRPVHPRRRILLSSFLLSDDCIPLGPCDRLESGLVSFSVEKEPLCVLGIGLLLGSFVDLSLHLP